MVNQVGKAALKPVDVSADQATTGPAKTGESKFDKVRVRQQDEQAQKVNIPPEIKQVSAEQHKVLQSDLAHRLQNTKTTTAQGLYRLDMKKAKENIQHLTNRVDALPKTPAFEPFRQRLINIDAQYRATGHLVNSVTSVSNPGDLMKIQVQMYQLTENLELMSKVVDQVTSGMKTILQTQL